MVHARNRLRLRAPARGALSVLKPELVAKAVDARIRPKPVEHERQIVELERASVQRLLQVRPRLLLVAKSGVHRRDLAGEVALPRAFEQRGEDLARLRRPAGAGKEKAKQ